MKKLFYIIPAMLVLLTSCDGFFKLDNHEGYNAEINGKFIDVKTGDTIPFEPSNGSGVIVVYEQENADGHQWDGEAAQEWRIKFDGTYANTLIFAGIYRVDLSKLPIYPQTVENLNLKRGKNNNIDFKCTPYARVDVSSVTADHDRIYITCTVEAGDPEQTPEIALVQAYCHTDKYVCTQTNKVGSNSKDTFIRKKNVPSGETVELVIQKGTYPTAFQYERPYYVRVAATAKADGVNANSYPNLSKVFKVYEDGKVEEVKF